MYFLNIFCFRLLANHVIESTANGKWSKIAGFPHTFAKGLLTPRLFSSISLFLTSPRSENSRTGVKCVATLIDGSFLCAKNIYLSATNHVT